MMKDFSSDQSSKLLNGLTVLEFSHTVMGPCAGLLLADLGADVIKVEPAPDGDKTRQLPGFASGFFDTFNRNKRSVAINLKTAEGQTLVHKLAQNADIVLDNYGPGTMKRLGCDWDQLKVVNSGLVYLSLKGFLKGPWQHRPALDEVVQFYSGLAYMTGPPGKPLRAGASIIDILGAVFGVTGALAAIRERDRTGKGQRVGSSLFESAAFLMASHIAGGAIVGEKVPPMPARKGAWGIYDVFQCKDEQSLFVGVTSDIQWVRFCDVFKLTHLKNDSRLDTNPLRTQAREWLIPELQSLFASLDYAEVIVKCQDAEISWAPIGTPESLITNEQLLEPGGLLSVAMSQSRAHALAETNLTAEPRKDNKQSEKTNVAYIGVPNTPLEFGEEKFRSPLLMQPPLLGEHTDDVLLSLKISIETIQKYRDQGIVV